MARKKRALALFEVIHKDQRFTPLRKRPLFSWRRKPVAPMPAPRASAHVSPSPVLQSANVASIAAAAHEKETPPPRVAGPNFAQRASRVVDWVGQYAGRPTRWVRSIALSQTSILGGIGVAAIAILCVLIVRQITHSPTRAIALMQVPTPGVHPDVLEVAGTHRVSDEQPVNTLDAAADADAQPATSVSLPAARTMNLNYVLINSYTDEKVAEQARTFLAQNGIPCTIEDHVKNWRAGFFHVIGLEGFIHISSADYLVYRKHIDELSAQFKPVHAYDRGFRPMAIKYPWNQPS